MTTSIFVICHTEPYKCKYYLIPTEYLHDENLMSLFKEREPSQRDDDTLYELCKYTFKQYEIVDLMLLSATVMYDYILVGANR